MSHASRGLRHGVNASKDAAAGLAAAGSAVPASGSVVASGAIASDGLAPGSGNQMVVGMLKVSNSPKLGEFVAHNHVSAGILSGVLGAVLGVASRLPIAYLNRRADQLAGLAVSGAQVSTPKATDAPAAAPDSPPAA
jgi:hypothetical protein